MQEKIARNIYRLKLPTPFEVEPVNIYFIDGERPTLIDTGVNTPQALHQLTVCLANIGCELKDIRQVLLTHNHVDHYGMAEQIRQISGADIFLHPREWAGIQNFYAESTELADMLESRLKRWGIPESLRRGIHSIRQEMLPLAQLPAGVKLVEDGTRIQAGAYELLGIHCPGHTPGQMVWYLQEQEILFSGDHVLKWITPNPELYLPPQKGCWSGLPDYLDSLGKVARLEVKVCLPGHGEEIHNFRQRVRQIYQSHRERQTRMEQLFCGEEISPYELTLRFLADIKRDPTLFTFFLGLRETIGHLALMEREGKLVEVDEHGESLFSLERSRTKAMTSP